MSVLLDLARILHVDVEALTDRPWQYAPNGSPMADGLVELRRSFTSYNALLGGETATVADLAQLWASVAQAHRVYQAARYDDVIRVLPGLLEAVEGFPGRKNGLRRESLLAYVSAYTLAAKLVTKLGAGDLAILAADRAANAAVDADSWAARGMAGYQVACALLRSDQIDDAERMAVDMAERLLPHAKSDAPPLVSVVGALWLIAAVIAGRKTERNEAERRLDQAQRMAGLLGEDANHAWTAFGPINVAIHRVSVAAELGDAGEALHAAALARISGQEVERKGQANS